MLQIAFGSYSIDIPVRGMDESWEYLGGGSRKGKQTHIASIAEELCAEHGVSITRSSTVLVDDDLDNIAAALEAHVRAVPYWPSEESR